MPLPLFETSRQTYHCRKVTSRSPDSEDREVLSAVCLWRSDSPSLSFCSLLYEIGPQRTAARMEVCVHVCVCGAGTL